MTSSFIPSFTGPVITPADEGHEHARQMWNVMHDRRPTIIAECTSADDVVAAIAFELRDELAPITGSVDVTPLGWLQTAGDVEFGRGLAYGSPLRRLQGIKAVYDPENIFRLKQNIAPVPA